MEIMFAKNKIKYYNLKKINLVKKKKSNTFVISEKKTEMF